jgi:hypothetical protein
MNNPEVAHLVSDMWLVGPGLTGMWLNGLITLYTSLANTGKPPAPGPVQKRSDGRYRNAALASLLAQCL